MRWTQEAANPTFKSPDFPARLERMIRDRMGIAEIARREGVTRQSLHMWMTRNAPHLKNLARDIAEKRLYRADSSEFGRLCLMNGITTEDDAKRILGISRSLFFMSVKGRHSKRTMLLLRLIDLNRRIMVVVDAIGKLACAVGGADLGPPAAKALARARSLLKAYSAAGKQGLAADPVEEFNRLLAINGIESAKQASAALGLTRNAFHQATRERVSETVLRILRQIDLNRRAMEIVEAGKALAAVIRDRDAPSDVAAAMRLVEQAMDALVDSEACETEQQEPAQA